MPNIVASVNVNVGNLPGVANLPQMWEGGLCSCTEDCGVCCDVFWCTICAVSRVHDAKDGIPDSLNMPACLVHAFCCVFGVPHTSMCHVCLIRGPLRRKYNIYGDGCKDCCTAFFCTECAICQMHRTLHRNGVNPGHTCCAPSKDYPPPGQLNLKVGVQPGYISAEGGGNVGGVQMVGGMHAH